MAEHIELFFIFIEKIRGRVEREFFLHDKHSFKICFSTFATNLVSDLANYPQESLIQTYVRDN